MAPKAESIRQAVKINKKQRKLMPHQQLKNMEGKMVNKSLVCTMVLTATLFLAAAASAEESLVESVANGCQAEIESYCADVVPGQGRILACLYSRSDKLSGKCEYALYDAAVQLERRIAALTYVVNECSEDLERLCSEVRAGEGRLLTCLEKNAAQVSARCTGALAEIGLK